MADFPLLLIIPAVEFVCILLVGLVVKEVPFSNFRKKKQ